MNGTATGARRLAEAFWLTVLSFLALSIQVAPIGLTANAVPSPDLLLCVIFYFRLHLPRAAPVLVIFALALCRDMVIAGPMGAGALAVLMATEALRARRGAILKRRFALELPALALVMLGALVFEWLMLLVSFAHGPALIELAPRLLVTVLAYPLVALVLRYGLGLRDQDAPGHARLRPA